MTSPTFEPKKGDYVDSNGRVTPAKAVKTERDGDFGPIEEIVITDSRGAILDKMTPERYEYMRSREEKLDDWNNGYGPHPDQIERENRNLLKFPDQE